MRVRWKPPSPPPGRGFTLDEYVCALFDLTRDDPTAA